MCVLARARAIRFSTSTPRSFFLKSNNLSDNFYSILSKGELLLFDFHLFDISLVEILHLQGFLSGHEQSKRADSANPIQESILVSLREYSNTDYNKTLISELSVR